MATPRPEVSDGPPTQQSIATLNSIAELRRAKKTAEFFDALTLEEQSQSWSEIRQLIPCRSARLELGHRCDRRQHEEQICGFGLCFARGWSPPRARSSTRSASAHGGSNANRQIQQLALNYSRHIRFSDATLGSP